MSLAVVPNKDQTEALVSLILGGDLSKLKPEEKTAYYIKVCNSVGLNPYTKPFDYMNFQGREILYANKGCAEQLRGIHGISIETITPAKIGDLYVVTATGTMPDGRKDSSIGAINVATAKGEALANAMMKAETKAKRRLSLSMVGLGNLPDESELEDMRAVEGAAKAKTVETMVAQVGPPKAVEYVVPSGPYSGFKLADIASDELAAYIADKEDWARKNKKTISGDMKDFLERAKAHLKGEP